jgi:alginate O-acetyltransferase complex protein AlgI
MVFTSVYYFLFFISYFLFFNFIKSGYRLHLIIIGSLIFYGWGNPVMILVPVILSAIAFWGGRLALGMEEGLVARNRLLVLVVLLLVPLTYFKYKHFLYNEIIVPIVGTSTVSFGVALPLGISFMTFTIVSYVVDVYKKRFPPTQSFFHVFAYVLYFPRLIAGPITRPSELIPQLLRNKSTTMASVGFGLTLFTIGLVKKVLFADSMGDVVNPVFDNPMGHSLLTYWLAMLGYTVQIYCDFSGYTDMALGSSIMLGVRIPINFNKPYLALNLQDFWHRWHITLSKWLRQYIYIPLGGNRCSKSKYLSNIIVTMVVCGIWHGANWTFLLWGILHGIGLLVISVTKFSQTASRAMKTIPSQLKWLLTFIFIVVTWVVFRSPNVDTARIILIGAFTGNLNFDIAFFKANIFHLALLVLFAIVHRFDSLSNVRFVYRWINKGALTTFLIIAFATAIAITTDNPKAFIYFDF